MQPFPWISNPSVLTIPFLSLALLPHPTFFFSLIGSIFPQIYAFLFLFLLFLISLHLYATLLCPNSLCWLLLNPSNFFLPSFLPSFLPFFPPSFLPSFFLPSFLPSFLSTFLPSFLFPAHNSLFNSPDHTLSRTVPLIQFSWPYPVTNCPPYPVPSRPDVLYPLSPFFPSLLILGAAPVPLRCVPSDPIRKQEQLRWSIQRILYRLLSPSSGQCQSIHPTLPYLTLLAHPHPSSTLCTWRRCRSYTQAAMLFNLVYFLLSPVLSTTILSVEPSADDSTSQSQSKHSVSETSIQF